MLWRKHLLQLSSTCLDCLENGRVRFERIYKVPDLFVCRFRRGLELEESFKVRQILTDHGAWKLAGVTGNIEVACVGLALLVFFLQVVAIAICLQIVPNCVCILNRLRAVEPDKVINREQSILIKVVVIEEVLNSVIVNCQFLLEGNVIVSLSGILH